MDNENNELKQEIKNLNEEINKMKAVIEDYKKKNNNAGCFSGNGEVKLRNNRSKKIKHLRIIKLRP